MDNDTIHIGDSHDKTPTIKPEMREGTKVFICYKEHQFYLEQGIIEDRDHRRYRVKFTSQDKRINGKCIWFPEDAVEPIPKELSGDN